MYPECTPSEVVLAHARMSTRTVFSFFLFISFFQRNPEPVRLSSGLSPRRLPPDEGALPPFAQQTQTSAIGTILTRWGGAALQQAHLGSTEGVQCSDSPSLRHISSQAATAAVPGYSLPQLFQRGPRASKQASVGLAPERHRPRP